MKQYKLHHENNQLEAFGSIDVYEYDDYVCLNNLQVHTSYRNLGIGSGIIRNDIHKLRQHHTGDIRVECYEPMVSFYEKYGFVLLHKLLDVYVLIHKEYNQPVSLKATYESKK